MKKFLVIFAVIIMILIININGEEYFIIPNDAIRFRIIANSNNVNDQRMKVLVKENLEKKLEEDLVNVEDVDTSRAIIRNNIDNYKNIVSNTLKDNNYNSLFTINYGKNYFPEKIYKGVKYEEGYYESLVVSLGNGSGDNFWCVLFPPICNLDFDKNSQDIEYKFLVKDVFDKYLK